jgi:hypothetical protein
MATLACPECDTHVDVPDGTRLGVQVDCPRCNTPFLTPDLPRPRKAAIPAPVRRSGRSDYLDADDFTPVRSKKPKRPRLVISGAVTVCCIVGSVLIAAAFAGVIIYSVLTAQERLPGPANPGGVPFGHAAPPPAPWRPDATPAPAAAKPPETPKAAATDDPFPPTAYPQPATADEAWTMLVGIWKLEGKPAVAVEDEGSILTRLRFDADKSAVLTDNLFATTKGATSNFDDPHELVRVTVTKAGLTLHLRQKSTGEAQPLPLSFEAKDRIAVRFKPREAGPAYQFRFVKN